MANSLEDALHAQDTAKNIVSMILLLFGAFSLALSLKEWVIFGPYTHIIFICAGIALLVVGLMIRFYKFNTIDQEYA
jgi:hypothetical protein